jgi:hypothetical protein
LFTNDDKLPFACFKAGDNSMSATTKTPVTPNQAQQSGAMSKLKKIEWYAGQLIGEAVEMEKTGKLEEAVVKYLNAADMLMLLAKGSENYTAWKQFSDRAIQCQQRSKVLMAKVRLANDHPSGPARPS